MAPWRSVYKFNLLMDTDVTFLLTTGGHNAGIVSEPGAPAVATGFATRAEQDHYIDPDTWSQLSRRHCEGSWWPEWVRWLAERSGQSPAPPTIGAPEQGLPR